MHVYERICLYMDIKACICTYTCAVLFQTPKYERYVYVSIRTYMIIYVCIFMYLHVYTRIYMFIDVVETEMYVSQCLSVVSMMMCALNLEAGWWWE